MLEGEHLHLALLMQKDGLIPKLLQYMKVDVTGVIIGDLQERDRKTILRFPGAADNMYSSRRLSKLICLDAEKIAERFKDEYVSVEHHVPGTPGRTRYAEQPRSSPDTA